MTAVLETSAHPGRALYSILRYWRSSGLQGLNLPVVEEDEDPKLVEANFLSEINELNQQCSDCQNCGLSAHRSRVIPGKGTQNPKVLFLNSQPLVEEEGKDSQGDEVGELMRRMVDRLGLDWNDIYFTHAARCKTPGDRPPDATELNHCRSWLERELELVKPAAIVTLGTVSTQHLLQLNAPISRLRGKWHTHKSIPVMPTYHPLFLLKKPAAKKDVWTDMQAVLKILPHQTQE